MELYKLAVDLQAGLTNGITGYGSIDALATGITDALSAGTVGSIDASGAVSYTHLDVYKRQISITVSGHCGKNARTARHKKKMVFTS